MTNPTKNDPTFDEDIGKNLSNLMKQAQKMQDEMKRAQEELTQLTVEGKAGPGAGVVNAGMDGKHNLRYIKINPTLLEEDIEMLQDLIVAAVNDAVRQVEVVSKKKINELTAGLKIPTDFMKDVEE